MKKKSFVAVEIDVFDFKEDVYLDFVLNTSGEYVLDDEFDSSLWTW